MSGALTISAVIPTRDRAAMVGEAIASLLAQSRPPDEILIIDDGSTDDTARVLAGFGPALRVLHTPGLGPSGARNAGLAAAQGEAVLFLDSDDLLAPDALAALEAALAGMPDALLAHGTLAIDILPGGTRGPLAETVATMPVLIGTVLFRTAALRAIGGFAAGLRFGEDTDLFCRVREAGWPCARIERTVLRYRRHPGNMTQDLPAAQRAIFDVARRAAARRRGEAQ